MGYSFTSGCAQSMQGFLAQMQNQAYNSANSALGMLGSGLGGLGNMLVQSPNEVPKVQFYGGSFIDHLRKEIHDWHGDWSI